MINGMNDFYKVTVSEDKMAHLFFSLGTFQIRLHSCRFTIILLKSCTIPPKILLYPNLAPFPKTFFPALGQKSCLNMLDPLSRLQVTGSFKCKISLRNLIGTLLCKFWFLAAKCHTFLTSFVYNRTISFWHRSVSFNVTNSEVLILTSLKNNLLRITTQFCIA